MTRPSLEISEAPRAPAPAAPRRGHRLRELIASDLALHGLAYLGVLLMFVGTFGFVVFAFGELDPFFRPVAEAAIPLVCFLGAWFLHRERAPHVAIALETLGGLTLPVVAFASFADDADLPPDLSGDAIAGALAVSALAIGAGYAWWARRHRESPLRYLVVPMAWMAVWGLGTALGSDVVEGVEIRGPNPAQMAWFTVAVTATVAIARAAPARWLARETLLVAPVGLLLGIVLGFSSAEEAGWPVWAIVLTGTAAVVGVDLLAVGSAGGRRDAARLIETALVAATALMLGEPLGTAWPGTVAAIGAIALAERWRLDGIDPPAVGLLVGLGGVGLAASLTAPWPSVVACGIVGAWAHVRRPEAPTFAQRTADAVTAIVPLGVLAGLIRSQDDDVALLTASVLVLVAAGAFHLRREPFDGAWTAGAGTVVGTAMVAVATAGVTVWLALAATVVATALALRPGAARIWTAWPASLLAGALWLALWGLGWTATVALAGAAGLALVVVATILPGGRGGTHELVGHLTTGAALLVAATIGGGPHLACLAAWTVGWTWTAVAAEMHRDPLVELLGRVAEDMAPGTWAAWTAPVIVLASLPALLIDLGTMAGWWMTLEDTGLALASLAVVEAGATWPTRTRPIPVRALADASILTVVLAWGLSAQDAWSSVAASIAVIVTVIVIEPRAHRPGTEWLAWLATFPVVLRLSGLWAGVDDEDLFAPLLVWSAALAVGAFSLDEVVEGPRASGATIRRRGLQAPAVLGALGVIVALGWVVTRQPADVWAGWFLAGAVVWLVLALQTGIGAISAVAWGLAIASLGHFARDLLLDEPWVAVAAAIAPAALGVEEWRRDRPIWARWDLPALAAAHLVVAWALVEAFPADRVAATWLGAAALACILAATLRRPAWAIGGGAIALVGTYALGPWWFALALALEATVSWLGAARSAGAARVMLQALGTLLSAGSWAATVWATGWADPTALRATAAVAGATAVLAAVVVRSRIVAPDWLVPAGVLALAGWNRAAMVLHLQGAVSRDHLVLAGSAAAIAIAAGLSATPAKRPWLRDVAGLIGLTAATEAALRYDLNPTVGAALLIAASIASLLAALALWRAHRPAWVRALMAVGTVAAVAAVPVAALALPDGAPLVGALAAVGVEAAAVGMLLRRPAVFGLAPFFLCAAWIVFASSAFTGEPMWFTVPVGLAALVVLETVRWDHRLRHEQVRTPELVAAELFAIAVVVGAAPLRILEGDLWAGLAGAVLGVAIGAWGIETHVRRRVWAGVASTAGCLLMLVLVPIVKELPNAEQATLWALLGGLGVIVVVIATTIERSRPKLRSAMHHLHDLMEGWE